MRSVLVAFSGGTDSTFLLKTAKDVLGENVFAVTASSIIFPETEIKNASKIAKKWKVRHKIIMTNEMKNPDFTSNPPQRCYFCKKEFFSTLKKIAQEEKIPYVLDGANFDDTKDFRPGIKAANELGIRSPLKEVGLKKYEIREISRKLTLSTWNKPSMACLASRFPYGMPIDSQSLSQVAQAEEYLHSLGFSQIRVRHHGNIARIEVVPEDFHFILDEKKRKGIIERLKRLGYVYITLDLLGYRTGSMNEPLKGQ